MKNLNEMKPDEVCAWIQKRIRELFGDEVENAAGVYASHGYYYIGVPGYYQLCVRRSGVNKFWKRLVKAEVR